MEQLLVELFSNASNMVIVRTPGRRFPGIVIQGDSLHNLYGYARSVVDALRSAPRGGAANLTDAPDDAEALLEGLQERIDHYEACLEAHGVELPYPKAGT